MFQATVAGFRGKVESQLKKNMAGKQNTEISIVKRKCHAWPAGWVSEHANVTRNRNGWLAVNMTNPTG